MSRIVKVCTVGLDDRLSNALRSICVLSRHPARAVAFEVSRADEADICLLDPDTDGAYTSWSALDPARAKPLLMIEPTRHAVPGEAHVIGRPVLAARLLARLDLLARESVEVKSTAANVGHVAPAAPAASEARQVSVLVVDDSVTVRTQVEQILRASGFAPTLAESGEEALRLMTRYRFDVVLLDVVLPGMDGYQICKTVKKRLRHKAPPIVMLTSKSSPFDKVRGSLAGCDSYLTKPTTVAELRAVLDKHTAVVRQQPAAGAAFPAA